MPYKKRFVDSDIFDADDTFARFQFHDPVHKKKGMAVRQDLLNFINVQAHETPLSKFGSAGNLERPEPRKRRGDFWFQPNLLLSCWVSIDYIRIDHQHEAFGHNRP